MLRKGRFRICLTVAVAFWGESGMTELKGGKLPVVEVGDLGTKDAGRWRIKWCVMIPFPKSRISLRSDITYLNAGILFHTC